MDTKNPQKPAKDLLFQVFVRTHSQSLKVIEEIGCQAYSKVAPRNTNTRQVARGAGAHLENT